MFSNFPRNMQLVRGGAGIGPGVSSAERWVHLPHSPLSWRVSELGASRFFIM